MTDIEELKTWCQKAICWHPDSIIHKVGSALLRFLKAEEAKPAAVPVCYGIFTNEGKMYWSEHCIGDKAEDLEAELEILQEDDPDDGWEIRPMYAAAPAPAPQGVNEIAKQVLERGMAAYKVVPIEIEEAPAPVTVDDLMYEDELPESITDAEYAAWFAQSSIKNCVRMGPRFPAAPVTGESSTKVPVGVTEVPEDCKLVAHHTGDGWVLAVEDKRLSGNVLYYLAWPASWPQSGRPS